MWLQSQRVGQPRPGTQGIARPESTSRLADVDQMNLFEMSGFLKSSAQATGRSQGLATDGWCRRTQNCLCWWNWRERPAHRNPGRTFSLPVAYALPHLKAGSVHPAPLLPGKRFPQGIARFHCSTRSHIQKARLISAHHHGDITLTFPNKPFFHPTLTELSEGASIKSKTNNRFIVTFAID